MTESDHYSEYGRALDVHHITPAREFEDGEKRNAMENLISLCVRCHTEWEKIAPLRPDTAAGGN
jgi:predicted HNH restriction endonuclease